MSWVSCHIIWDKTVFDFFVVGWLDGLNISSYIVIFSIILFRITLATNSLSLLVSLTHSVFTLSLVLGHLVEFHIYSWIELYSLYIFDTLFQRQHKTTNYSPTNSSSQWTKPTRKTEKKNREKHWKKADFLFIFLVWVYIRKCCHLMKHINFVDAMTRDSFCSLSQLSSLLVVLTTCLCLIYTLNEFLCMSVHVNQLVQMRSLSLFIYIPYSISQSFFSLSLSYFLFISLLSTTWLTIQ